MASLGPALEYKDQCGGNSRPVGGLIYSMNLEKLLLSTLHFHPVFLEFKRLGSERGITEVTAK